MVKTLGVRQIYRDGSLRQEDWYPVAQVTGTNVAMTVKVVATAEPTRVEVEVLEQKVAAADRLAAALAHLDVTIKSASLDTLIAVGETWTDMLAAKAAYEALSTCPMCGSTTCTGARRRHGPCGEDGEALR